METSKKSAHQIWREAKERNLSKEETKELLVSEGIIIKKSNPNYITENQELRDEREVLIKAFSDITKEFDGRDWITVGRGSYAFDDEEYRNEVSYLFDAFKKIESQVWENIKSKTFEYKNQIEAPLIKQNEELKSMLKNILPMFTELDSQFGIENPPERQWDETEIATVQSISNYLEKHSQ